MAINIDYDKFKGCSDKVLDLLEKTIASTIIFQELSEAEKKEYNLALGEIMKNGK